MKKEELIKLIKSLPDDKCLASVIYGRFYILSCKDIETSKNSRCYVERVVGDHAILKHGESYDHLFKIKADHEKNIYTVWRSHISIDKHYDEYYSKIDITEPIIDKYKYVVDVPHNSRPRPSNMPVMTQRDIDEFLELKEQEKIKEEKKKQDAGISNITTTTTGKVDNNTEVKKSVIFPDCPRNEKWSDETILNIVNFVNSGIVYDEKQYTIVSHAVVGFLGDLADYVLMGHVWDIKNKRALVLKEKHKKYNLFFKNGKYTHCLDIIPNEDIVASYKVEGVL